MRDIDCRQIPESLINILLGQGDLSTDFLVDLEKYLQYEEIPKNTHWVESGEICRKVLFIQDGFLYSNFEEENYTSTTWFMKENDIVFSVESFLLQKPSSETIIALEDTRGWYLTYTDLRFLIDQHPCFHKVYSYLIEHYYILSEKRAANLRKRDALDRYRFLIEHYPEIVQRVPLKLIASYLCIKQETLSRIRARI